MIDYEKYTFEDFVNNHDFHLWVVTDNQHNKVHWEKLAKQNPKLTAIMHEAEHFIRNMRFVKNELEENEIDQQLRRFWSTINRSKQHKNNKIDTSKPQLIAKVRRFQWAKWMVAASILIFSFIGVLSLLFSNPTISIATDYAEKKTVVLPDNTSITLNANSILEYPKKWKKGNKRSVNLVGEAFFDVASNKERPFSVATTNFDVNITGTKFSLLNRTNKQEVLLTEGSLYIDFNKTVTQRNISGEYIDNATSTSIALQKGELISVVGNTYLTDTFEEEEEKSYLSWLDGKLIYDNTPIAELIDAIENFYGLQVVFSGNKNELISGTIPIEDLNATLAAIATVLDYEIDRTNEETISIRK